MTRRKIEYWVIPPEADAEFYRLFLGAQETGKEAVTALRIAART